MGDTSLGVIVVRVLGLGDDGARATASVARSLRASWHQAGKIDVRSGSAADDPRGALRTLRQWCDRDRVDVVLTVGRAGHRSGDFAPEITAPLLERSLPGVEERMYLAPPSRPQDLLFRGRAGFRGTTLIVNLPAQTARAAAIVRLLAPVIRHALEKARGSGSECGSPGGAR
jgi:molybdopterin biosynthesis enzyme MoaB